MELEWIEFFGCALRIGVTADPECIDRGSESQLKMAIGVAKDDRV
jgi:hypothetical protein